MTKEYPNSILIRILDEKTLEDLFRAQRLHMELHGGLAPKPPAILKEALAAICAIWQHKLDSRKKKEAQNEQA